MAENLHLSPTAASMKSDDDYVVETDFLIVGAGVAGGALACFLASYGTIVQAATLVMPY